MTDIGQKGRFEAFAFFRFCPRCNQLHFKLLAGGPIADHQVFLARFRIAAEASDKVTQIPCRRPVPCSGYEVLVRIVILEDFPIFLRDEVGYLLMGRLFVVCCRIVWCPE
ncbi:MAG: hypothetical protein BWY82_01102 [Verrucomicrobia bacterium ADurb.Bin474]|nr:MAG: hypothetical protein BWY82_01102 [Verrucomicrobia bacterium ADurb.Bin474]